MISIIHKFLDGQKRPTYVFERAASLLLEAVLLVIAAIPSVVGWRSAFAAALVGVLRLYETELRREEASVLGRHKERGGVSGLPPEKVARAAKRADALEVVSWLWPGLVALVQAAESGRFGWALVVSVGVTLVRVVWGRKAMPAWRRARVAWRTRRDAMPVESVT